MRNWIIEELYSMILFSTLSDTASYLIWRMLAPGMTEKKKLRYVYPMLAVVMAFFLVPILQIWFRYLYIVDGHRMKGTLFLWTPFIFEVRFVLLMIWLVGAVINIGVYFYRLTGMRRLVTRSIIPAEKELIRQKDRLAAELHLHQKINVYKSYSVSSPIVIGLCRKCIILPVGEYGEKELEVVLYHELVHIRQHIVELKHIGGFILIFHWFNPCARALIHDLDEWGETACDLAVHYDTECRMTFREYFGFVLKGIEKEQIILPDSVTQFQKAKGVEERLKKVKNYKKERDFKVTGGILMMSMFIGLSATTALAAGTGYEQVHNVLYDATEVETEESYSLSDCIEYQGVLTAEEEQNIIEMPVMQRRDGSFAVDWEVPAGTIVSSSTFTVSSGKKIRVNLTLTPDDQTVKVGIIKPDGTKTYINGEDMVAHSFSATKTGSYRVYIENENDVDVLAEGTVSY